MMLAVSADAVGFSVVSGWCGLRSMMVNVNVVVSALEICHFAIIGALLLLLLL